MTPPIGGDRLPRNTYSITRSPRRTKDWGGRFDLDALRGPASIWRRTVHLRFGSRLQPESRASVTTTFSPVVLHGSWSHGPSEPDATKTCRVKVPETFLSRLSSSRRRAVAAATGDLTAHATLSGTLALRACVRPLDAGRRAHRRTRRPPNSARLGVATRDLQRQPLVDP